MATPVSFLTFIAGQAVDFRTNLGCRFWHGFLSKHCNTPAKYLVYSPDWRDFMGVGYQYSCSHCDYEEVVSPDRFYVHNDEKRPFVCSNEDFEFIRNTVEKCAEWSMQDTSSKQRTFIESRTGSGSDTLCLSCHHNWFHAQELTQSACPSCNSSELLAKWFLRDRLCPYCKQGTITSGSEPDWIS
jgi:hypothetical protein